MNDQFDWPTTSFSTHVKDCAAALAVLGIVYVLCGVNGLVIFVYSFSVCVVILLLLSTAISHIDFDDDDYFC
jgi:hypothetical protein